MTRAMKDSGIEWIGQIPENWEVKRLKNLLKERKEKNDPIQTKEVLSLLKDRGVIPYSEKGDIGNKAKEDVSKYKLVYPNDIVLNSMNIIIGSVGKSNYYGVVSPVYYVLNTKNKNNIDFYNYVLKSESFQKSLIGLGNGILEHRMRIPIEKLNGVSLPLPPLEEQERIASILDEKVERIDAIIADTKQSIEELKQYKQSLITETVTKGLDKNVPMKDSGIEWIGQIPKDWEVLRIKTGIKRILSGKWGADPIKDDRKNLSIIRIADFNRFNLTVKSVPFTKRYINKYDDTFIVKPSCELLIEKSGGGEKTYVGQVVKYDGNDKAGFTNFISKLTINLDLFNLSFLNYVFSSLYSNGLVKKYITQTTGIQNLDVMNYLNELIVYPPLEEQERIANFLNTQTQKIEQLIQDKEALIAQYEEYKKSMIYEYVTGKREI